MLNFLLQFHIIIVGGSLRKRIAMGNTKDGRTVAGKFIKISIVLVVLLCFFIAVWAIHVFTGRGLFGYTARIVMSTSMEKSPEADAEAYEIGDIPFRSFVLIRLVPSEEAARENFYAELQAGDVLTFVYRVVGGNITVTHRVSGIERRDGGYVITLRGDNGTGTQVVNTADPQSGNLIVGKVVWCSPALGAILCVLRSPLFWLSVCIVVLAAALLHELLCGNEPPRPVRIPSKGGKNEK